TAVVADVERAAATEACRVVDIVEDRTLHGFDRAQRVGAARGVTGDDAGGHIDADSTGAICEVAVLRKIEATAAIDVIIAGKAEELFVTAAAQQRVAEHRAHDGNEAGERIGADASRRSEEHTSEPQS